MEPHIAASALCTRWIEIEPSPTADATRFTFPERISPTAKAAGRLVSSICGGRLSGYLIGAVSRIGSKSRPVRMNPCLSRATHSRSHSVRGEPPAITNTWRISCTDSSPVARFSQVTRSRCESPASAIISVWKCNSMPDSQQFAE